jgi:hypothetical protein
MPAKIAIAGLVLMTWLTVGGRAQACSCLFAGVENSYENADDVLRVRALAPLGVVRGQRYYLVAISAQPFKGCLAKHSWVVVQTPSDSASCGISMQLGSEYLLYAASAGRSFGLPVLSVNLCSGSSSWADVSTADHKFLDTREVCCGGHCACYASASVECLVDPCSVSTCAADGAVCRANYCGGCNAEWTDADDDRVCLPQPSAPASE